MGHSDRSIGIFDSGLGGLTVMKAICDLLPSENIIYFGDTARVPYGTKSQETILRYAIENTSFLIQQDIKVLVIACHTACCVSLEKLQEMFPIPIIGVTYPSVESLKNYSSLKKIAVLGTHSTIASNFYQTLIRENYPHTEVSAIACQLFVNLVEEGFIHHPLTNLSIEEYLKPLKEALCDTILLGCTHFPLLSEPIRSYFSYPVNLIDPALACAKALSDLLIRHNLLRSSLEPSTYQFYVSDAPNKFSRLAGKFFSYPITNLKKVDSSLVYSEKFNFI